MKKVIHPISLSFSFQDTIPSGNGYIMLDREFVNWPLFYDDAAWKLFTYLLMRANYTLRLWGTHQVKKGELVTSYQHLADALNKSRDEIKRLLKKLKDIHEVETVRIGNALLIKLPNYLKYMRLPDKKKGKSARPQPSENPEQIPDESTNKESKEGNNFIRKENLYRPQVFSNNSNGGLRSIGSIFAQQVKNVFPYRFNVFPPDENEVRRYVAEKDMDIDLDRFFDHYNANGWCQKNGKHLDGWHFACVIVKKRENGCDGSFFCSQEAGTRPADLPRILPGDFSYAGPQTNLCYINNCIVYMLTVVNYIFLLFSIVLFPTMY